MKNKLDMGTMITAVGIAAYAAIALAYLAHHVLGIPLPDIREAAVTIAGVIAVPVIVDVFFKKPGRAK